MPGLMAPENYPNRRPTDGAQVNGRIVNPVRYAEIGGLDGPGKWPSGNQMKLEAGGATSVKAAHTATGKNTD
ncbi:MAG TPA: hypothetical protein VE911_01365 [Candidatus Nitrosopolaris sp.]|nr:hypothetical protein [Candidatus Nitrosopolaris sp.]